MQLVCLVCGYVHEGEEPPEACPVCGAGPEEFERVEADAASGAASGEDAGGSGTDREALPPRSGYLAEWERDTDPFEEKYARVVALAKTGKSSVSAMRTRKTFEGWDSILFKGGQLARPPLEEDEAVSTRTVIGPRAKRPLVLEVPFYVSHMSFGALSREAKIALAKGSAAAGTAIGSGEGGLLPEERAAAARYIYELGTAAFSHVDDAVRQGDAVEIKIGQSAKPGLGGHLPAEKVTEEIARIRGIRPGEPSISPARYHGVSGAADLRAEVDRLREVSGGVPIGIKIAAGHLEADLEIALGAGPDFVTVDCRGGGTGAAPDFVKDNVCLPPVFAISRARKFLDGLEPRPTLCVTGGFRDSADIAKALAMGAEAVALATASLIAIGCQQYRICHTGRCPVGITTQDPDLRKRLDPERSAERLVNFFTATRDELRVLARINGRRDVHDLDRTDLFTLSDEVANNTDIPHA